ncbi:hypothetical protein B484DRAFT_440923 [Ochromonadaceae sp. CCMP2298]|nr:hypothetical protein B484DRAFT_440923 [Ochromonadaceae sp. CCMP2298]
MPTAMLLTVVKAKLDEGLLQAAAALKTTGTSFVEDSGTAARGVSLDMKKYPCNAKKEIAPRMSRNMSLTRLLDDARFSKFLPEIVLDHRLLEDTCKMLSDTRALKFQGDVDFGLQDYNHIQHLPVFSEGFGESTRVASALRFEYNGTDMVSNSILEFAEPGSWALADFKAGKLDKPTRDMLRAAANNLQRFCVVFYGPEFKTAFKPLIDALDNDPYLWEDLENRFIL